MDENPSKEPLNGVSALINSNNDEEGLPIAELRHEWIRSSTNIDCSCHNWTPRNATPRGVVLVFHGLGGHALFPTIRYLAELLVEHHFIVYAMDFCGHGQSYGLRGYLPSLETILSDALLVTQHVKDRQDPALPFFLAGGSMGGAIALLVSLQMPSHGLLLLAPMVTLRVPPWQRWLLKGLASCCPKLELFRSSDDYMAYQFRDPLRRAEVMNDKWSYKGRLRVATAHTCVQLAREVEASLSEVSSPLLCLLATEDIVVDNNGIDSLMKKCSSSDKTLIEYNAFHGLMCEPQPLRGTIERDIIAWLEARNLSVTFAPKGR